LSSFHGRIIGFVTITTGGCAVVAAGGLVLVVVVGYGSVGDKVGGGTGGGTIGDGTGRGCGCGRGRGRVVCGLVGEGPTTTTGLIGCVPPPTRNCFRVGLRRRVILLGVP